MQGVQQIPMQESFSLSRMLHLRYEIDTSPVKKYYNTHYIIYYYILIFTSLLICNIYLYLWVIAIPFTTNLECRYNSLQKIDTTKQKLVEKLHRSAEIRRNMKGLDHF